METPVTCENDLPAGPTLKFDGKGHAEGRNAGKTDVQLGTLVSGLGHHTLFVPKAREFGDNLIPALK